MIRICLRIPLKSRQNRTNMSISVAEGNTCSVLSRLLSLSINGVHVKLVSSRSDGGGGGESEGAWNRIQALR